jgi:ABC-2 type transport system ATP-binding protein
MNMIEKHLLPPAAARQAAPAVSVRALRKSYGEGATRTDALLGIDLDIQAGEIVGVLGPNGAGKTTLVSILEGLVGADAGTARVLGADVSVPAELKAIRQRIGVAMQNSVLPPLLTAMELLNFLRTLYHQGRAPEELLEVLGMQDKRNAQLRHLSGGQQQRVAVALALVGDPELMFLDEPTSQLDPQARRVVWDLLMAQRERRGAAVLVTTHQMEEAERLCDRVVILDEGQIKGFGSPRQLIDSYCPERLIEFVTPPGTDLDFLGNLATVRDAAGGQLGIQVRPTHLNETLLALTSRQDQGLLEVRDLRISGQTLEDVFLKITGRGIRA